MVLLCLSVTRGRTEFPDRYAHARHGVDSFTWRRHCRGLYQTPIAAGFYQFAMDTLRSAVLGLAMHHGYGLPVGSGRLKYGPVVEHDNPPRAKA
jgi:hypothetical protein